MEPHTLYDQKRRTASEAYRFLNNGENLILGMGVAMPPALMGGIAEALRDGVLTRLKLYYMHGSEALKDSLLSAEFADNIQARPLFLSRHDRAAMHMRKPSNIEFVPASLHQAGRLLTEQIEPHCFMVTVSPMDKHGYFSLGTNADYGASVIRKAHRVVVEVNEHMPRTFGETPVHISEIDAIVENHTPLGEVPHRAVSDVDVRIAEQVIQYIDDGDTLQMGVGGVPNAVLSRLHNHKDLGLHSELFSPLMVDLIRSGVLNGRQKSWMQHRHVYTLALGDKTMYDFMDDNPAILGYPASWVNNPSIIRKNTNMVSVNGAIEIDLSGQINAETLAGQPFSGTGGQLDFVRGAYASPGGRSFIALHATAKNGTVSRIVPQLQGATVTDTRMDAHYVVTEHGCVNLKGLSLAERARAIIKLAQPEFQQTLESQAHQLGLI